MLEYARGTGAGGSAGTISTGASFNKFGQYDAAELVVTLLAGSDLAARLPIGWSFPVGKYTPLVEASMRQRGLEAQIVCLLCTVSEFAARNIFPNVPTEYSVAIEVVVDVRAPCLPQALSLAKALSAVIVRALCLRKAL